MTENQEKAFISWCNKHNWIPVGIVTQAELKEDISGLSQSFNLSEGQVWRYRRDNSDDTDRWVAFNKEGNEVLS